METRYRVDDVVLYGTEGICRITQIEKREMMDELRDYYILKPVYKDKTTILVPVNNEKLVSRMRLALTEAEALAVIKAMPSEETAWIENEGERIATYKSVIASGETQKIAQIIKALYQHKKEQEDIGKKAHAVDDRLLKSAESLLYDEFAYALGIEAGEVVQIIAETLEPSKRPRTLFNRKK